MLGLCTPRHLCSVCWHLSPSSWQPHLPHAYHKRLPPRPEVKVSTYNPSPPSYPRRPSVLQAGEPSETSEGSKARWYEEKKKRQEEALARLGLTPEEAHRLESAEVAEAKYKKKVWVGGGGAEGEGRSVGWLAGWLD